MRQTWRIPSGERSPLGRASGTRIPSDLDDLPYLLARYETDPTHASAWFKVRHLMVSHVRGELRDQTAWSCSTSRSSVDATIDVTAINTRSPDRDAHLRSADFLDVTNYPNLTFRSGDRLRVIGDLMICGITNEVGLMVELTDEVRDPWGNLKRGPRRPRRSIARTSA